MDQRFDGMANDEANIPAVNGLLRVEIEDAEVASVMTAPVVLANAVQTPLRAIRVDLTLSDGRRVLIEGPTALVLSRFSSDLFRAMFAMQELGMAKRYTDAFRHDEWINAAPTFIGFRGLVYPR